ncbi:PGF-pre-PGF domain-containing protein [Candidatus Woesearchaeota archaeon]|nr:PGF-pre-PGF domain-containing protein [Candidatus Woesearchaeota archaeon]MBT5397359.1 PGF-pre-PGF domain-containing protein [Candidatus Woesearchaeota archaeon]MBT6367796.1 PGF-pre-PGF domain-containing protein [Candidatus Woesearchaeota archaeon]MBT7762759.1 PGF-pre-PGF domain-containing protein [Candidatus Woesearchaeota archaeon]
MSSVSALEFNGTTYNSTGSVLGNVLVNLTVYQFTASGPTFVGANATYSNASGWFNLSVSEDAGYMYKPVLSANTSSTSIDYVGQSLPTLPHSEFSSISNVNFFMQPGATINITVINSTNDWINFSYVVKDVLLGYEVASGENNIQTGIVINVPRNRNYSIMIYPDDNDPNNFVPSSYTWNNFSEASSYNLSTTNLSWYNNETFTLHKQFNVTEQYAWISGWINYTNNSDGVPYASWDEFKIAVYALEAGSIVYRSAGTLPFNTSSWRSGTSKSDTYDATTGWFNITLPYIDSETVQYLLFAGVRNGSEYLGGYRNITVSADLQGFNFTLYGLLGNETNLSLSSPGSGDAANVSTKVETFYLINASNATLENITAHIEVDVDYSNFSAIKFTFIEDLTTTTGSFNMPLLNVTGIDDIDVYSTSYAPSGMSKRDADELISDTNITLKAFRPGGSGMPGQAEIASSNVDITLYRSNETCDVPNPPSNCNLEDTATMETFSPLSSIIGGGAMSFRMGVNGVNVHYVNVDLLASGPPDALFEDNSGVTSEAATFDQALRFGSSGPTIYDYILISVPYSSDAGTGVDESADMNVSLPTFYDEDWNIVWNVSDNGTNMTNFAANYSHFATYNDSWDTLMGGVNCTKATVSSSVQINASSPCAVDLENDRMWVRLPHFSGTSTTLSGTTKASDAAAASTSSSSSSSSGGSGGTASSQITGEFSKVIWNSIDEGTESTVDVNNGEVGISAVTFGVNKKTYGAWLRVAKVDELPGNVATFEKSVYKNIQITRSSTLTDDVMTNPTIEFTVAKTWLAENGLANNAMALFRYADGEWNKLPTTMGEDDGTYIHYTATTPGFSYFLIGENGAVPVTEEAVVEEVVAEEPVVGEEEAEGEDVSESSLLWLWILLIIAAIVIGGGIVYFVRQKK